jgi:hypothetical protein
MNKDQSQLRYQMLDSTHIEIMSMLACPESGSIKGYVDLKIVPWGLRIYGVRLMLHQGKWSTALPTRTLKEPGRYPREVEACEFTTHAKRFFDKAVLNAVDEYMSEGRAKRPNVLQHFSDFEEDEPQE